MCALPYVLQILEEEAYTCARSCGCPASFQLRESTWQDILTWFKDNRVEWLAGITTGLTAVPTAVAFAILAGLSPAVGLRGTWIIMLVMSLFGGESRCAAREGTAAVSIASSCDGVGRGPILVPGSP